MEFIGGYYLRSRDIQNGKIATQPPYVREIWNWLLKEANSKDRKLNSEVAVKKGQMIRSYKDIQEDLHWLIGWRRKTYAKWQIDNAFAFLREHHMVVTQQTKWGTFITILNYNNLQNPANYKNEQESSTGNPQESIAIEQGTNNTNTNVLVPDVSNPQKAEDSPHPGEEVSNKESILINKEPKKKTKAKTHPRPETRPLVTYFCNKYREHFKTNYIPNWGRDTASIKRLLEGGLTFKTITECIDLFFIDKDSWLVNTGYTISLFASRINRYATHKEAPVFSGLEIRE